MLKGSRRPANTPSAKVAAVLLLVLPMLNVEAIDLSWQPRISLGTRATDNLRWQTDDEEAAWGFDTGGGLVLQAQSDTWRSRIAPAFNFRRFVIGEDADADEYQVKTQNQWAFLERASASLDFDYIRDSTLSTELVDTGRENAVVNRDTISVSPNLNFLLSEKTSLNTGFFYTDVSYEERDGIPFTDYDFKQFNTSLSHAYTDTLTIYASGYISEFRTPDNGGKSLTYGGMGGINYRYSETLDGDFAVGYTQSEIDFLTQQQTGFQFVIDPVTGLISIVPVFVTVEDSAVDGGPIARASIHKAFERFDTRLDYSRSVSPSAFGAQSVSDDILVIVDHDITRRLSLGFRGGYNMRSAESDQVAGTGGNLNRDLIQLGASVRYRYTEEITLAANYRFGHNDLIDINDTAVNNSLFVTLTYNGEPHFYRGF